MIGAAAPARLARRLVHDDALAAFDEANRGGKTGESGAYDVNGARHQMKA